MDINVSDWFPPSSAPLELDLGCGDCKLICELAKEYPYKNYLGVELKAARHAVACERIEREGIHNARAVNHEARDFLATTLRAQSVSGAHVYFPTPFPALLGLRERLLDRACLSELHRVLQSGGFLRFATDHDQYFQSVLNVLEPGDWWCTGWETLPTASAEMRIGSGCEELYHHQMGRPIFYLQALPVLRQDL